MPSALVGFMGTSLRTEAEFSILDESEEEELAYSKVFALDRQLVSRKRAVGEYARVRNVRTGRYRPAVVEEDKVVIQEVPISSIEENRPRPSPFSIEEPYSLNSSIEETQT